MKCSKGASYWCIVKFEVVCVPCRRIVERRTPEPKKQVRERSCFRERIVIVTMNLSILGVVVAHDEGGMKGV